MATVFSHNVSTWLLANALHPVMLFMAIVLTEGAGGLVFMDDLISPLVLVFFCSLLFSLPCLFLSSFSLVPIVFSKCTISVKFLLWLMVATIWVILTVFAITLSMEGKMDVKDVRLALPGVAATWFAIIIRYKQFSNLILQNSNTHEDNP